MYSLRAHTNSLYSNARTRVLVVFYRQFNTFERLIILGARPIQTATSETRIFSVFYSDRLPLCSGFETRIEK